MILVKKKYTEKWKRIIRRCDHFGLHRFLYVYEIDIHGTIILTNILGLK